jgi:hypothetical protein
MIASSFRDVAAISSHLTMYMGSYFQMSMIISPSIFHNVAAISTRFCDVSDDYFASNFRDVTIILNRFHDVDDSLPSNIVDQFSKSLN